MIRGRLLPHLIRGIRLPLPEPPLIANSMPKSGTHLLVRLLSILPKTANAGEFLSTRQLGGTDGPKVAAELQRRLAKVRPGTYVTAHMPWGQQLEEDLKRRGFAHIFIVRDPRAVVASYVPYVMRDPTHFLHERFMEMSDDDQRVEAIITGMPPDRTGGALPSVAERIQQYLPWLVGADAVCRFEDLVGPAGGGDLERQLQAIDVVARACRRPLTPSAAEDVGSRLWSSASPTFRKGRIGSWTEELSAHQTSLIAETAGELIARLGYGDDEGA